MKFYLITNVGRDEPKELDSCAYIHIKAHISGTKTEAQIRASFADEKTFCEMQTLLDSWIDAENVDPPLDADDNPMLQSKIDLAMVSGVIA